MKINQQVASALSGSGSWKLRGCWIAALVALGAVSPAQAQEPAAPGIHKAFEQYAKRDVHEKLFMHIDRSQYVSGDQLWFKLYAAIGTRHKPIPLSKVAYVELLDGKQTPVLQAKIELRNAMGYGSLQLPATLPSGKYTLRAYTNWMKNFGPEYYYHSSVAVVNTFAATLPAAPADSAAVDVQFFPEGGNLVRGLPATVAFKITGKDGRGLPAEGTLLDAQGQVVARFKTLRFGMGRFTFTPTTVGNGYTAVVKLPNQETLTRRAPAVYEHGYVLSADQPNPSELRLTIAANTSDATNEEVYVLGHAGQQVVVAKSIQLAEGRGQLVLQRTSLPEGILHFTLFNGQQRPVCERLYFRRPQNQLVITAATDKARYSTREKVRLNVSAAGMLGPAAPAHLSVAVYRLDSLDAASPPDIGSYLWLTSDLRGLVENPSYYLQSEDEQTREAADNLMLTQGWRRFSWEKILANVAPPMHVAELNGHLIQGRVLKDSGVPAAGIAAFLASPGRAVNLYSAVSKPDGTIGFETRNFYGPKQIVLQTNTRRDSTYRFDIINPFSTEYARPWPGAWQMTEQYRPDLTQRHLRMQIQNAYLRPQRGISPSSATESTAFFGQPNERYRLDDFTRFKVMEEVMREYVPGVQVRIRKDGFHFMVADPVNRAFFNDDPIVLIDGVPFFDTNVVMKTDPLKVQRLEVLTGRYLHHGLMFNGLVSYVSYQGDMAGQVPDPRALMQAYEGLQQEREFYAPRYETEQQMQSRLPDLRQLLYWNPAVITAASTTQQVDFYTSDEAGKYVVLIQGLANTGLSGNCRFTFEVTQSAVAQGR
ncbi:hypothetical protein [Hymenobacter koreensis]|uniref:Plug domain-containing protein n=1 Tax=Hymenobacter koreensis TaxID=1084523 RepID=A0ABP8IUU3_9BACT